MSTVLAAIEKSELGDRIITERQLAEAVGGSPARRYGLVNRALKDGILLRLKRGLYTLAPRYRSSTLHPYTVAQALLPGSYVSFQSALSFHGWAPEAVYATASVTPQRKSVAYDIDAIGHYTFSPLATNPYQFLVGVERRRLGGLVAFVASPLRALMDIVAATKTPWSGMDWVTQGMRVDIDALVSLSPAVFLEMRGVYKHKSALAFLAALDADIARMQRRHD
ncbi:hypothetical protein ABI_21640 [Asticcacaulis biprosthecium C19]|uniref:Transcriptional regulator, AbiEi antitoxin, Type IV TA system n=1 Tax=Asticcacaulis biprosthecium C19 TaxID=715226 RepID=F4QGW9_9CAUL|nr:hypothetical protein [Asticcacaulis biprosthecium]EGF93722.1 hypothetical protein ABI_21640 [Asticcacaulis biprosthecium C19]